MIDKIPESEKCSYCASTAYRVVLKPQEDNTVVSEYHCRHCGAHGHFIWSKDDNSLIEHIWKTAHSVSNWLTRLLRF